MPACILERWKKNFNGRYFFSWFFVARANQKIRILALGRGSSSESHFQPRPSHINTIIPAQHTTMESDRKPSVMMWKFLDYNPSVRRFGTALQSSALRKGALLLLRHLDGPKYAFRSPRNSRKGRRSSLPSFSATDASFGVPILRSLMKSPERPFHGVVYEVKNVEEKQKLVEYNGAHYSLIPCKIDIEDGSRVWGCTFKWEDDESCLREGAFDIGAWRKQQRECPEDGWLWFRVVLREGKLSHTTYLGPLLSFKILNTHCKLAFVTFSFRSAICEDNDAHNC
jgi:hypothetical protein